MIGVAEGGSTPMENGKKKITITLPESLAIQAKAEGLLTSGNVEHLLREQIRRRRVDELFEMADRLANVDLPPMSEEELDEAIHEDRGERSEQHACRP
jgi:hypothetical protein